MTAALSPPPAVLTPAQLTCYRELGYLIVCQVFSPFEIATAVPINRPNIGQPMDRAECPDRQPMMMQ